MEVKKSLAYNLVQQYHGDEAAREAEDRFRRVVQRKEAPDEVPEKIVPPELLDATWVDLCTGLGLSKSKGEHRRLMRQGGFYVDQEPINDIETKARVPDEGVLVRLGKRQYFRLVRHG